jgi:hypothetical protein
MSHTINCDAPLIIYIVFYYVTRSSSDWTFLARFFSKFGERNSAILVSVHLVDNLFTLLESNEISSGLNHSSELVGADGAIAVEIHGVEGLIGIETWSSGQSLSQRLSSVFASDVSSPHVLEFKSGVWEEAVISSDSSWDIVGSSSVDHAGVVLVVSEEGLRELGEVESSVAGLVISVQEEVGLIVSWIDTDGVETLHELVSGDLAISDWLIEDVECVEQVEVRFVGKVDFTSFKFLLEVAELLTRVDEFILVMESEDWLSGRRKS